jgi:pimeloyl-ACP methyl ester carboxylesterase
MVLPALLPCLALALTPPAVETRFVQVVPDRGEREPLRSPQRERAVVLIHGLKMHPVHKELAERAELHPWQQPGSDLVKRLGQDSDVFAFAYAQNVPAADVADQPALGDAARRLRRLGYREVVLIGHSAGGIVARHLVEDDPDCGVTRVLQVCAPNAGSSLARWGVVRSSQRDFLASLSRKERSQELLRRAARQVPAHVEFVCVVGTGAVLGDGVVRLESQWPDDLRLQGVPAHALSLVHGQMIRSGKGIELLAKLAREPQPRWDPRKIAAARKEILGE